MIGVVRVRGLIGTDKPTEATLRRLHLYRKNFCSVIEDTASNRGMLNKLKDLATWGEVTEETVKLLKQKTNKPFFRLNSPRKGFGRKGIKKAFSTGGALGERKDKINDLIQRML